MGFLLRVSMLACLLVWSALATAQEPQSSPDYEKWRAVGVRAEEAIQAGRASDQAFEQLRTQVAAYRQVFLTASNANSSRIQTLQSQLTALGPVPEEGAAAEDPDIATRRAELLEQLGSIVVFPDKCSNCGGAQCCVRTEAAAG